MQRKKGKMNVFTSDHRYFHLEKDIYEKSKLLTVIAEEFGNDQVVPLPNITSHILMKIIKDTPHEENRDILFDMANAADYLQMDELLDETCKEIAELLKGKTSKEIRRILNISDDHPLQ